MNLLHKFCTGVFTIWLSSVSIATAYTCRILNPVDNEIHQISSSFDKATHIILPENMASHPIVGNSHLWTVEGKANHIFIKPNSDLAAGAETTLTLIDTHNHNYEFLVKRVTQDPDLCVRVMPTTAPSEVNMDKLGEQIVALEVQLKSLERETNTRIEQALIHYRHLIYTGYQIKKTKGVLKNMISDIWDDGRFTFIRLQQDNQALVAISAMMGNTLEIVDYTYDSDHKMYTIHGIYPAFLLRYGQSMAYLKRKTATAYTSY